MTVILGAVVEGEEVAGRVNGLVGGGVCKRSVQGLPPSTSIKIRGRIILLYFINQYIQKAYQVTFQY